ncbi:hypothetical protein HMPREF3232_01183 [Fannyhessea vaginae]|nr:hypothetical protein HMPREF3232_01183 [Fannyhessea vaginae]
MVSVPKNPPKVRQTRKMISIFLSNLYILHTRKKRTSSHTSIRKHVSIHLAKSLV